MKLSLVRPSLPALSLLSALSIASAACSSTEETTITPPAQPAAEAPVETPASNVRKLVDGTAQPTSPVNLLTDPGFALVSRGASYVGFLAFEASSSSSYELETTVQSRSPAGFAGAVAIVSIAEPVIVLARVPGGQGPFRAQIWVSRSDAKGKPAPASDAKPVAASLTEESPDGNAIDLTPVPDATRTSAGRTWVLHRAEVTKPMPYGGFLVIETDGPTQLAAPEVTSGEVVVGAAVRSRPLASAPARSLRAHERAAIQRFRAIKPLLVPASSPALHTPKPFAL